MFKEFNVEFQDVEMIGGADNLLENTKVTKVVMSGDNKMSSLDSAFKNCSELDNIQGGLELNGVSDIDNILEGNNLIKSINLKNVNNENISANNSFPNVEEINICGDSYNKKAIQNVIASKEWTFDNFNYTDNVGDNVIIKEANVTDDNQITIKDTLEQKAKGIEIVGQTYKNLANGKGEYNLTDTYNATWNENNNSFENMPNVIEISEIYGNTVQDESDLSIIQSVGDLYVDEEGSPILDDEGNEQYKLEIESGNDLIRDFRYYEHSLKRLWNGVLENSRVINATILKNEVQFQMSGNILGVSILGVKANTLGTYTIRFKYNHYDYFPFIRMNSMKKGVFVEQPTTYIGTDDEGYYYANFLLSKEFDELRFTLGINTCFDATVIHSFSDVSIYLGTGLKIIPQSNKTTILMPQQLKGLSDVKDRLFYDYTKNMYVIENKIGDFNNINDLSEAILSIPKMIETKTLEKPSLETYSPKTYISTNSEVQPSQMTITSKNVLINLEELNNNTDYTIQFKCNYKGYKPIKFNLCGSEKEVDAVLGVNHINITTPNELSDSKLELSGAGNKVADVMLIEGDMKQYPNYFDGIKSVGALQDDNTYRIDIKTNEDFIISIKTDLPLSKEDRLYWNDTNKRYEIDRNGEIEILTVEGDVIDLPRLYQRDDTLLTVGTDNIKPSEIKIEYKDLN